MQAREKKDLSQAVQWCMSPFFSTLDWKKLFTFAFLVDPMGLPLFCLSEAPSACCTILFSLEVEGEDG